VVGQTELDVFKSIAAGSLSQHVDTLIKVFGEHYARVSNERMWSSVFDNATFVLSRYGARASQSERTAADRLLGELESLAGGKPPAPAGNLGGAKRVPRPRPKGVKRAARGKRRR
jgi:hypothetical protein